VAIPQVFEAVNYEKVYGMRAHAEGLYARLTNAGTSAEACIACSECLERCLQHIPIPDQMDEARTIFRS